MHSIRPHWLTFFDLNYGGNPRGLFTAAMPIEALHALENGIFLYTAKELFNRILKPCVRDTIDNVVKQWYLLPRQSGMVAYANQFPCMLFKDGVSHITDVSAATKVGILFSVCVATLTKKGQLAFTENNTVSLQQTLNIIHTIEMLLCYWAWMKQDNFWALDDKETLQAAKTAIATLLKSVERLMPCKDGQGWYLPKMHEQLIKDKNGAMRHHWN